MKKLLVCCLVNYCLWSVAAFGVSFNLPKAGNTLVGSPQSAIVKEGDDFSSIAQRFDLGYYEVFEANPGIDPDKPAVGTVLIIPSQYIIPTELVPDTIVINLAEMRLYYVPNNANKVYVFPVGIGKEDWETPQGEMKVVGKIKDPEWVVPDSIMKFREAIGDKTPKVVPHGPENPLGDYALRLSTGDYLIHGTNLPAGVGRRSSAGCIRLYPADIKQLFGMANVGTKVFITNKPYKTAWHGGHLYLEAHMPLFEQRLEMGDDMKPAVDAVKSAIVGHNNVQVDWNKVKSIAKDHLAIPMEVL